jgi:hypothetical protein
MADTKADDTAAKSDEATVEAPPAAEPGPSSHDTCGQFPADEVAGK